jgi:elongation factor Ts
MAITAALVKELRERTGAGMMDCKRALVDADGDIEQAGDLLRKAGQAKADKKAARVAAEGQVIVKSAEDGKSHVVVEVNSETDFVAKDENFAGFAAIVADSALSGQHADLESLMASETGGSSLEILRQELVAKVGENIAVRRFDVLESSHTVGAYSHMGRIGVLVEIQGGDESLARDLAMQIAEGKPEDIVKKMVEGRLRKHLDEITLTGQPFVKDPDTRVEQLLAGEGARALRFVRYEVGEGIEKKADDFVQEVMAQASQSR